MDGEELQSAPSPVRTSKPASAPALTPAPPASAPARVSSPPPALPPAPAPPPARPSGPPPARGELLKGFDTLSLPLAPQTLPASLDPLPKGDSMATQASDTVLHTQAHHTMPFVFNVVSIR